MAVFLGLVTISLWSFQAFFTVKLNHLPALFAVGVALSISGMLSLFRIHTWKVPFKTFAVGIGGIFGYHLFYFSAMHHAPAIEASLVNYLWPLCIVFFTPLFFRGYRLRIHHIAGVVAGFIGTFFILTGGHIHFQPVYFYGYLLAFSAALCWSLYSLMTKRLAPFPTSAVGAFCLVSGILSLFIFSCQGNFLNAFDLLSKRDMAYLLLLGIGPMGAAFFTWDAAMKRGDPRIIGALTYLTPLGSTLILVKLGGYTLTPASAVGMIAIVFGAFIGTLDLFLPKK